MSEDILRWNRACSYCSRGGHNRRTCGLLADDQRFALQSNRKWRKAMYEYLCDEGISVGSVINFNTDDDGRWVHIPKGTYLITKVNWHCLSFLMYNHHAYEDNEVSVFELLQVAVDDSVNTPHRSWQAERDTYMVSSFYHPSLSPSSRYHFTPVAPIPKPQIDAVIPAGWHQAQTGYEAIFSPKRTRKWDLLKRNLWFATERELL